MLNITNNTARQRHIIAMTRLMQNIETNFGKEISSALNGQYNKVAKQVSKDNIDIDYIIDSNSSRIQKILAKYYKRILNIFGKEAAEELNKQKCATKDVFEDVMNWISSYSITESLKKSQTLNKTTKRILSRIVRKGRDEGLASGEIAKKIRATGRISNKRRSLTIARTETHSLANGGVDKVMNQTRIEMEKEWATSIDERTRNEHITANGERTPKDGFFTATGESLKYPGDPAGSAWNIINCRCVSLYHTVYKPI